MCWNVYIHVVLCRLIFRPKEALFLQLSLSLYHEGIILIFQYGKHRYLPCLKYFLFHLLAQVSINSIIEQCETYQLIGLDNFRLNPSTTRNAGLKYNDSLY